MPSFDLRLEGYLTLAAGLKLVSVGLELAAAGSMPVVDDLMLLADVSKSVLILVAVGSNYGFDLFPEPVSFPGVGTFPEAGSFLGAGPFPEAGS